ncbi:MAG TPA: LiaF domain-containing protein, partial [Candidatus Acidoferrales bacterium]|nr:LiaF domain-containing protein [Candidatus Acidoferrales bacterium]
LAGLDLTHLEVHMGAGEMVLDLTGQRKQNLSADIHGGVGQARIRLPKDVGVRAHATGGIGAVNAHGLTKQGDDYVNAAYGKTPTTIDLSVEGGIGEIDLDQE